MLFTEEEFPPDLLARDFNDGRAHVLRRLVWKPLCRAAADEPDLTTQAESAVSKLDMRRTETSARLVECELDTRMATLELMLERQTRSCRSLRELTVSTGAAMSQLAVEVERLCEGAANAVPAPVPAASPARAENAARPELKAMFAFADVESNQAANREDLPGECPKCLSRDTRLAHRRTWIDKCLRPFSLTPWRCRGCGARFYRATWAASLKRLSGASRF